MPLPLNYALLITIAFALSGPWISASAADITPTVWSELKQQYRAEQRALVQKEKLAEQAVEQAKSAQQYAIQLDDREAQPIAERALETANRALQRIRANLARLSARLGAVNRAGSSSGANEVAVASRLHGTVQIKTSEGWVALSPETKLKPGQEIRTGADGRAEIMFSDGSMVNLSAKTTFMLESFDGKTSNYKHSLGLIKAYFKKYAGRRFKVRTPTASCAVRGTEFLIETSDAGASALILINGEVELSTLDGQKKVIVRSGERVIVTTDGTVTGPEPYDLKTLQPWWDD